MNLDREALASVRDILMTDPQPDDMKKVKERMISAFSSSEEHNLRKLLKGQVLTDRKPSRILQRLRNLNSGSCDDKNFMTIFLDQLPEHHRAILVATGVTDLDKIAETADRLSESASIANSRLLAVTSGNNSGFNSEQAYRRLEQKFDAFSKKLNDILATENPVKNRVINQNVIAFLAETHRDYALLTESILTIRYHAENGVLNTLNGKNLTRIKKTNRSFCIGGGR